MRFQLLNERWRHFDQRFVRRRIQFENQPVIDSLLLFLLQLIDERRLLENVVVVLSLLLVDALATFEFSVDSELRLRVQFLIVDDFPDVLSTSETHPLRWRTLLFVVVIVVVVVVGWIASFVFDRVIFALILVAVVDFVTFSGFAIVTLLSHWTLRRAFDFHFLTVAIIAESKWTLFRSVDTFAGRLRRHIVVVVGRGRSVVHRRRDFLLLCLPSHLLEDGGTFTGGSWLLAALSRAVGHNFVTPIGIIR